MTSLVLPPRSSWQSSGSCWKSRASKLLGDADVVTAARAVLRREHADAGAASDLIDGVEQVHDVEAHRHRFAVGLCEFVGDAGVELHIRRFAADVGVARAQAGARDHVGAEPWAAPP